MRFHLCLLAFVSAGPLAFGQVATNSSRAISLDECVQMALARNLDIQISRYSPLLSQSDLTIAYAGYDPNFSSTLQHNYSLAGGSLDANKLPTPPATSDTDSISTGITGLLPYSGMTYNLSGNLAETYGKSGVGATPFDTTSGRVGVTLTQPLLKNLWIDSTRLNIAVARNRIKFTEAQLRLQIMNTISAVEQAYYDLVFARENVKVQEKALQLAERLLSENKRRVEVGALAPLDEKQSESQVAQRRADRLGAQSTLEAAQNALKKLISDDYVALNPVDLQPGEMLSAAAHDFNLQESWRRGLDQRADLQQSKLDLERNGIQLRYYKNQVFPQLDIFGTYGHGASGGTTVEFSDGFDNFRHGNRPFYTYGLSLSIPLGNRAAQERVKSTKLTVEQALLTLKKLEQDIMVQIDDSVKQAKTNFERVDATRQARVYAEAALEAEQKKLENGKSTSFEVLRLQSDLTAARSAEIRALADYNEALTSLAQTEGSTLERRKIDVKVK